MNWHTRIPFIPAVIILIILAEILANFAIYSASAFEPGSVSIVPRPSISPIITPLPTQLALKKPLPMFSSCTELQQVLPTRSVPTVASPESSTETDKSHNFSPTSPESPSETHYSKTNTQVADIDEADIVKTDGQYIYTYVKHQNVIHIVSASDPTQLKSVAKVPVSGLLEFFVHQNVLTTFSTSNQNTEIIFWDITDRTQPKNFRTVSMQGQYVATRLYDGHIYMALTTPAPFSSDKNIVPLYRDTQTSNSFKPLVDCNNVAKLSTRGELSYLTLASFSITDINDPLQSRVVFGNGATVYMSYDNFYVTYKEATATPTTTLVQFPVYKGNIDYRGHISFPGHLVNQFALDEHDTYLRVATTEGKTTQKWTNSVYVFDQNLHQVGSLKNLGLQEKIYAVRFMGNRAYIVTFRETDPLYAIDLSNPRLLQVLGELKIPGFSEYLHPYNETHLIGIGKDADSKGIVQGLKMALFDVTDIGEPKQVSQFSVGTTGTDSEVLQDHKALLFDRAKDLLVLPMVVYEKNELQKPVRTFRGAYVFHVSPHTGFEYRSRVSHITNPTQLPDRSYNIRRSIYINDHLFTISDHMIVSYQLGNLTQTGSVEF